MESESRVLREEKAKACSWVLDKSEEDEFQSSTSQIICDRGLALQISNLSQIGTYVKYNKNELLQKQSVEKKIQNIGPPFI